MKSPLRYPGGKSSVSSELVSMFPDFKEYREPFIGGGSVFLEAFSKYGDSKTYWINDLYNHLFCFWRNLQNNPGRLEENVRYLKSSVSDGKELFTKLSSEITSYDDEMKAAAFYVINRISFSGTSLSGGYSQGAYDGRFNESAIQRMVGVSPCLQGVKITNEDYSVLLRESGDGVFVFMDPPYYTATKSALYGKNGDLHKGFDHERFFHECSSCGHKWMITYDDCEYIRDLFKDYCITPMEFTYGMKNVNVDADKRGKEIIITNYNVERAVSYELF